MIPRDLFFLSPLQLLNLLWIIPLALLVLFAAYKRKKTAQLLIQKPLQGSVLKERDPLLNGLSEICMLLGWILAVLALMQPLGNEQYFAESSRLAQKGAPSLDLYVLLDVSQSMAVRDLRSGETRLQRSVQIADQLIAKLQNDQVALFAFTSSLVPLVPITYDRIFVRLILREVGINEGDTEGTNFENVLAELKKDPLALYPKSAKAIVFFSDGGDNQTEDERKGALALVKEMQIPFYTIGVGSAGGGNVPEVLRDGKPVLSKLDEELLKAMAQSSGGRYFAAGDEPAEDLASRIAQSLNRVRYRIPYRGVASLSEGAYQHYFQVPLALAIAFFILGLIIPKVRIPLKEWIKYQILVMSLIPMWGESADPGATLFAEKEFQEAARWYQGELQTFPVPWLQDKLFYNLGTSLVAAGNNSEAKRAFLAVSKEAYTYPLFRLRLIYNRLLALRNEAEKHEGVAKALLLQEALLILQTIGPPECGLQCPEYVLNDLKKAIQFELSAVKDSPLTPNAYPLILDTLISLFHLKALWPDLKPESLLVLDILLKSASSHFPDFEKVSEPLKKSDTPKELQAAAFALAQIKKSKAQTPVARLKGGIETLILTEPIRETTQKEFLEDAQKFYPFVFAWQILSFHQGECFCEPWKEVLPLYSEGLSFLRAPASPVQLPYVYNKWQQALTLLENPPKGEGGGGGQKPESADLQELQEMQTIDRQLKTPAATSTKNPEQMEW